MLNPFRIVMISKLVIEDPNSASAELLPGTAFDEVFLSRAAKYYVLDELRRDVKPTIVRDLI